MFDSGIAGITQVMLDRLYLFTQEILALLLVDCLVGAATYIRLHLLYLDGFLE